MAGTVSTLPVLKKVIRKGITLHGQICTGEKNAFFSGKDANAGLCNSSYRSAVVSHPSLLHILKYDTTTAPVIQRQQCVYSLIYLPPSISEASKAIPKPIKLIYNN